MNIWPTALRLPWQREPAPHVLLPARNADGPAGQPVSTPPGGGAPAPEPRNTGRGNGPSAAFRRRLGGLILLLAFIVAGSVILAVAAGRAADRAIGRLASVELESAQLARQFRGEVDELHSALLRLGIDPADDSVLAVQAKRRQLTQWLAARQAVEHGAPERRVLQQLGIELAEYFRKLDAVAARPDGFGTALERAEIANLDDMSVRLQSLADDFDAIHDAEARALLDISLSAVERLRNQVLVCLALLVAAVANVGTLLYRDLVRPLRTQLVEVEELSAKREKLAALGTLAAGVAHEIRNPLTAIKARLFTLRRATAASAAQEDVQAIAAEIDRLEAIVRDVLGYARPTEPKLTAVELSSWVRDVAAFLRPECEARGIQLEVDAPEKLAAQADPAQLRQIVLNLVRNAIDALGARPGRITLAVRRERPERHGRAVETAALSVTDDGPGIPPDVQARLFDPFFTTKSAGTGLGLSIVARLVSAHHGDISFQTAPGAGTRFVVRLPLGATPR